MPDMALSSLLNKRDSFDDSLPTDSGKRFKVHDHDAVYLSPASTPSPLSAGQAKASPPAMTPTNKTAAAAASTVSRPNMSASSTITLEMLRPHFEEPLAQVAAHFGICVTLLKKICRRHGIARWPHRQITGLRKSIASMEHAIGYFEGARRDSYAVQLNKQRAKLELLLEDPTAANPVLPGDDDDQSGGEGAMSPLGAPADVIMYNDNLYARVLPSQAQPSPSYYAAYRDGDYQAQQAYSREHHQYGAPANGSPLPGLQSVCAPRPVFQLPHQQPTAFRQVDGTIQLPPLRADSRPVLPPISSLVVPQSEGLRQQW